MRHRWLAVTAVATACVAAAACDGTTRRAAPPSLTTQPSASALVGVSSATASPSATPSATMSDASPTASVVSTAAATTAKASATATHPSSGASHAAPPPAPKAPPVKGATSDVLSGTHCQVFPGDNYWHADVRGLPVDAHSAQWLAAMGASSRKLHPDFGPSYGAQPVPYGIPITVVPAGHPRVPVQFDYSDESDHLGYPLGADTAIEGGPNADGDRHAIVVTADTCELFETYDTHSTATGWTAGSGAHWSLSSEALRPDGWTSADAAGLPILPGLLRWDEVATGHVDHAIRFTTNLTDASHLWPARHDASSHHDPSLPPMGARFRLKASFDISHYSAQTQVVLRAMQTYGLVLADNGSPWYFQGSADTGWPDALISQLKTIPASAFEAVDTSSLKVSGNSGAAR